MTLREIFPKTVVYLCYWETVEARGMQVTITWEEGNKKKSAKRNSPSTRCTKLSVNNVHCVNSDIDNNIFSNDSVGKCSHFLYLQIKC